MNVPLRQFLPASPASTETNGKRQHRDLHCKPARTGELGRSELAAQGKGKQAAVSTRYVLCFPFLADSTSFPISEEIHPLPSYLDP